VLVETRIVDATEISMSLTGALYTGLSGLSVNQTQMNVVGNNIANVNTVAFKSSSALFSPQFYVTNASGSAPDSNFGGSNPEQTGLGAQVASIEQNFTQGTIQPTGKDTDMAVNGDGFFVTQDAKDGQQFTRDGAFTLNANHQLVTSGGDYVQGYGVDQGGNVMQGKLQNLTIPLGTSTISKATSNATLGGNLAADGTVAGGASVLDSQDLTITGAGGTPVATTPLTQLVSASTNAPAFTTGQTLTLNAQRDGSDLPAQSFTVSTTTTVADLQNFFNKSLGIDTSVAGAGANIVAGTAANSIDLQVTGNSGTVNALSIPAGSFADASGNTPLAFTADPTSDPTGESTATSMTLYDSLGSPVTVNLSTVLQSKSNTGTTWKFYATSADNQNPADPGSTLVGTGTLSFNTAGQLQSVTGNDLTIYRSGTGAQPTLPVTLNFSGVSALAQDSAHTGSSIAMSAQDGIQIGTLTTFSVGADGTITGSYDNGQTRGLGQVALATFNNPNGLDNLGGNNYATSAASGTPVIASADRLGAGSIESGSLEQSNVDLSTEFTNMITASTGFSAASRVISTADQMLTDLLNSQH
jgi:flagellar hook protein FlgE